MGQISQSTVLVGLDSLVGAESRSALAAWRLGRGAFALALLLGVLFMPGSTREARGGVGLETDAAQKIIALTNAARAMYSLPAFVVNIQLTAAAEQYAESMAQRAWFGHTDADGSTFFHRAEAAGYSNWVYLGENLANGYGPPSPTDVLDAWMKSSGHRDNLLSPLLKEVGVGCYLKPKQEMRYWCVQEFGTRQE